MKQQQTPEARGPAFGLTRCRVCKCTYEEPCNPPCAWEPNEPDLCTTCADTIRAVRQWLQDSHRPSFAALKVEANYGHSPGNRLQPRRRKAATR